jgi:hypothetical protein
MENHGSRSAWANTFQHPHLQSNQSKMEWRCGPSTKGPDLQVKSPEFKPQSHQKKGKTKKISPFRQRTLKREWGLVCSLVVKKT